MVNFYAMVQDEEMEEIITFLVELSESGISHPSIEQFFGRYKASTKYGKYNIKLIDAIKNLEEDGRIYSGGGYSYKKGPNWSKPTFAAEKKYGLE